MTPQHRPEWRESATCRRSTVAFVMDYRSEATATAAKAICAGCTVRAACLKEALSDPQLVGVWAGTTTAERKKMRRQRAA